jgi:peptidoglycan/LPS O-acetylase OafA/YrhL
VLIGATWSLTTEAHFYLLFPLFARPLLTRGRPLRALVTGAALCAFAWTLRAALHALVLEPGVRTALFELTQRRLALCRIDEFVLGALGALAYDAILASRHRERFARAAPLGLFAAALALVVAFRLEGALYLEPGGSWPAALMSLATAAIVLASCLCRGPAQAIVAPAPLTSIGVVSYGVFLYHQLLLGIVGAVVPFAKGPPGAATLAWTAALALAASLVAGHLSWRGIELPVLRRFAPKRASSVA